MNATPWLEALLFSFVAFGVLMYIVTWAVAAWNNRDVEWDGPLPEGCVKCGRAILPGWETPLYGGFYCPHCIRKIGAYDEDLA